jgi:hypothetical protein
VAAAIGNIVMGGKRVKAKRWLRSDVGSEPPLYVTDIEATGQLCLISAVLQEGFPSGAPHFRDYPVARSPMPVLERG